MSCRSPAHCQYICLPVHPIRSGTWLYRIKNTLNDSQALGVLVTSRPSSEVMPFVRVTAGKINNTITSPHPVTLFAEVKHGFAAVLGANVTAVIEPETGDPLTLTLLDDGAEESLLTSGVPSGVPPYIRCPQRSPSLHQVPPVESLLTSGVPSRVPPYIRCPQRSPSLHQVPPAESLLTSGVPSGVPPYISCPQQSPFLHQVPPVDSLLTSGADVTKGDGVYSVYLFRFTNNGRHTMKMFAEWTNTTSLKPPQSNPALYVPGYIENDTINMNPPRPVYKDKSTNEMFSRVLFLGSFKVTNVSHNSSDEDGFPPCKINDLEAKMENEHVVLFWTAPGDDYDQGAASHYDIRISVNPFILRQHVSRALAINASYIKPKNAGSRETFIFRLGNRTADQGIITYIAICSIDKNEQRSEISNLVHVTSPRFREEDTSHAYTTTVEKNSTTTVLIAAAFAVCLCFAIGTGVYGWRKCYKITNQTTDSGSLLKYSITKEAQNNTKCQSEEICLQ
ncbi:hypothetical protein AB205_0034040, partial [Aquarana catesbeiana]